jgi:hypothetical protein
MLDHDMDIDDPDDQILQDNLASHSGSLATSTHNPTVADTSQASSSEKTSHWTDHEITLLLDYIEASCVLNTTRGLTLKKSEFNKAHNTVKSKDPSQCHYKWGHVRVLLYIIGDVTDLC